MCAREAKSAHALSLHRQYEIVVWWATSVEVASALARLLRMKVLGTADWKRARDTAEIFAQAWMVVTPSESIRVRAQQIVEKYDLRAGDALQLAAALQWSNDSPGGRKFITADSRLFHAAVLAGFDALNL
jgi:predicted nucleic acid-binding protein